MPTSGILNASLIQVRIGVEAIAECTNVDLNLTASEVDQTSKSSAGWKARRPGLISGTVSIQGNLRFDSIPSEQGVVDLWDYYLSRSPVNLKVGTSVSGDKTVNGAAIITSLNIGSGTEDNATIEASFKFTGAITQTTNS